MQMQIDAAACWTLLKSHYASLAGKDEKQQKKLDKKRPRKIDHARQVVGLCKELADALDPLLQECVDRSLLEAAAILHDIAKLDKYAVLPGGAIPYFTDEHEEDAIEAIKLESKKKTPAPIDPACFYALDEVISAHKGKFDPHPRYALEAAILRMADKLDKVIEDRDGEAQESYEKSLKKIGKYCKRLSESIGDACQEVLPKP